VPFKGKEPGRDQHPLKQLLLFGKKSKLKLHSLPKKMEK